MNSFGRIFRISIFGESHGSHIGITIDGCPAGIALDLKDFEQDLLRRKTGSIGTSPRLEEDKPQIISGYFKGYTTGAPLTILFENNNTRSQDYTALKDSPRPGHADFVLNQKYKGFNDYRGGGHSSGRLTLALVAAGVIAKKIIPEISIQSQLIEAGGNPNIEEALALAVQQQDSIGGIVRCEALNLPIGWGAPFFDSLESMISHLAFSIPAIKGIAFGSGFKAAQMRGSSHNDPILNASGTTASNHAGGINGGLSNGNPLLFEVAVKPTSSTPQTQYSWNQRLQSITPLEVKGRHDLCIALRVPVVLESITAIALCDMKLLQNTL